MNILKWLDNKITYLKNNGIKFYDGVAILQDNMIYNKIPTNIETFDHRNNVPIAERLNSVLSFYLKDKRLFARLDKIDEDYYKIKEFGGICGFDLSPSILMIKSRQTLSMLINSVYNCYQGLKGIKILPNVRCGDFSTIKLLSMYPKGTNIVLSSYGCVNHGFKYYGLYQITYMIDFIKPKNILLYGNIMSKDYISIYSKIKKNLIVYPDTLNKQKNKKGAYTISTSINTKLENKTSTDCFSVFILQNSQIEIKPFKSLDQEAR